MEEREDRWMVGEGDGVRKRGKVGVDKREEGGGWKRG